MKIPPVGAELLHVDGQTEKQDEANSRFFFCNFTNAPKYNNSA
jgi:hypothetical protein